MLTQEQLKWSEEDTKSVEEYKKKYYAGEIQAVELKGSLKDLINNTTI